MRMAMLAVLASVFLVAADAPRKETSQVKKKLWAAISVSKPVWDRDAADVDPFTMFFAVVNDGDKTVDPDVDDSQLLVNDKPLKSWDSIIGNGPRDARWKALPAKDYISFGYALGEYFKEPGIYKVVWKGKAFQAPEIVFRVLAKKDKE